MIVREVFQGAAIDALVEHLAFEDVFPYRALPLDLARLEFLETVHDKGEILFSRPGRFGNNLSVLLVDQIAYGFHCAWRHNKSLPFP